MSDDSSFSSRAIREFHNALTSGSVFGVPRYTTALLPSVTSNQGGLAWDTTTNSLKGCNGTTWAAVGGGITSTPATTITNGIVTWGNTTGTSLIDSGVYTIANEEIQGAPGFDVTLRAMILTPVISTATAGSTAHLQGANAAAGSSVNGAAAGGGVTLVAGNAARLVSGNANGGPINITPGLGIGTGLEGSINFNRGAPALNRTITTVGTTGNQTIDKMAGTVNIAAGGNTVTVTNAYCTASSIVFAVVRTADATAIIKNVTPGVGSFIINIVASTGEVSIGFWVTN